MVDDEWACGMIFCEKWREFSKKFEKAARRAVEGRFIGVTPVKVSFHGLPL